MISDLEFDAQGALDILDRYHVDGVPRAAIQECAIGAFAGAFFAANAEVRINFDAAKRRMVFVGNPIHAILDGAIRHARGRAGTTGATFRNHGEFARLLLARRINAFRLGFRLDDFADWNKVVGQTFLPSLLCKSIFANVEGQVKEQELVQRGCMWWDGQNLNKPRRDKNGKRWNFRVWGDFLHGRNVERVFFWDDRRAYCGVVLISQAIHVSKLRHLIENLVADPRLRARHRRELLFPLERHYSEFGAFPEET